jgi:uncharacterized RDD family membrane protein YckC
MSDTMPQEFTHCSECAQQYPHTELIRYRDDRICPNCKESYFQRVRDAWEGGETPQSTGLNYASIASRFSASIVDGLIMGLFQMLLNLVFLGSLLGTIGLAKIPEHMLAGSVIVSMLSVGIGVAYYVLFLGLKGATPGKMLLRIKVVRPDGQPITYRQAFWRYIGTMISALILLIGYFMAFYDVEKRTLHDRIAGTRVIDAD